MTEKLKPTQDPTLKVNSTLKEAARVMRENAKQLVPVFDSSKFAGVVDVKDILLSLGEGRLRPDEMVMHIMKTAIPEVSKSQSLLELKKMFETNEYVRVQGEANRMISKTDLAAYLAEFGEQ